MPPLCWGREAVANRPLPEVDAVSEPYWRSVAAADLMLQKCTRCLRFRFYPRSLCPYCWREGGEWTHVSGLGTLISFTRVSRAPLQVFRVDAPYVIGLIDLDERVRLMARLTDVKDPDLQVGLRVRIGRYSVDGFALPCFRPETQSL